MKETPPQSGRRAWLRPATKTLANYREQCARLYEQGVSSKDIGQYTKHWRRWCQAGLDGWLRAGFLGGLVASKLREAAVVPINFYGPTPSSFASQWGASASIRASRSAGSKAYCVSRLP